MDASIDIHIFFIFQPLQAGRSTHHKRKICYSKKNAAADSEHPQLHSFVVILIFREIDPIFHEFRVTALNDTIGFCRRGACTLSPSFTQIHRFIIFTRGYIPLLADLLAGFLPEQFRNSIPHKADWDAGVWMLKIRGF